MKLKKLNYTFIFGLLLITILSFFAIKPFLNSGFFPVHDNTQVQRVFEMGQSMREGMFPVRWVKDLGYGYGYPIFNYYAPLPYYFAGIFVLLGVNALIATKIMFVVAIVLSGIFMYLLAKEIFGHIGGIFVALIYLYSPYHALNIFVRGDVGEMWSYAFIPLIFYSLYKIYKTKKLAFSALFGISYALIILSHNLSAFMLSPFVAATILVLFLVSIKKRNFKIFQLSILGLILGLLLSAFYFIPALAEMKFTNVNSVIGGGSDFRNHFVCIGQFWSSPWGFGGSNPGCVDGISFRLGKVLIIGVIIAIVMFIRLLDKFKKEQRFIFTITFAGLLVSIFLTLSISRSIWEVIIPMKFIQFPWRFLAFVSFFSSIIFGYLFINISILFPKLKNVSLVICCVLLLGIMVPNVKLYVPQKYLDYSSSFYTSPSNIRWATSKISDEYMPSNFNTPKSFSQLPSSLLVDNNILHTVVTDSTSVKEVVGKFPATRIYVINTAFFPGWKAYLNTNEVRVLNVAGKIGVRVTEGYGFIQLRFVGTQIEKSSNLFSIIGLISTFAVIILGIRQKNEKIS